MSSVYKLAPVFNTQTTQFRKPFEEYAHLHENPDDEGKAWKKDAKPIDPEDAVEFFKTDQMRDLPQAKSSFGHFATKYEVFIAGGTNEEEYALKQV